jgi:hypothetical protein
MQYKKHKERYRALNQADFVSLLRERNSGQRVRADVRMLHGAPSM